MRQRFNPQPGLDILPIEKVLLPIRSRDELPPILAGLQWIWTHPDLKVQIFALLEQKVLAGNLLNSATERIHSLWSKAGDPLTIEPAGMSPWVPL